MSTIDRRGLTVGDQDPTPENSLDGLAWKAPVKAATTAAITLSGLQTIDTAVLVADDRVLVKNQTNQKTNGIYNASAGAWTRAIDFDESAEILCGTQVSITNGLANIGATYRVATANPITIDSSNLTFSLSTGNLGSTLTALAALNSTAGFLVETSLDTFTKRTLIPPAAGMTITNPAGVAGDPTFAYANDLAALEGLSSTGIAVRTASDTWAQRTITGTANEITVVDGNGVAANPTLSLPAAMTMTGKTLTGGAYDGVAITTSTFNGNTWTAGTGTLTIAASKVATFSNTFTLQGTDGSTIAYGAGGTILYSGGALGTPSSATLTNATGLPLAGLGTQAAYTFLGNNTGSAAAVTAVDIAGLTTKASPAAGDYVMLSDQAASGAWKKTPVSALSSAGSVGSIAGNTGAFTLSLGITNSANDIRLDTGNLPGVTTNSSAAAGKLGEYIESIVLTGSAVSITNNTAANVTSISLTAGDWDVTGVVWINPAGTISLTASWTSSTSATLPTAPDGGLNQSRYSASGLISQHISGPVRFSLSGTTTVYLSTFVTFSSTCTAYGKISARRIR